MVKCVSVEGEKVGRFKGFCHFPCFQTLFEKAGRLKGETYDKHVKLKEYI